MGNHKGESLQGVASYLLHLCAISYKILRVKANKRDDIPTKEQINEKMQLLLRGWHYAEIQM